MKLTITRKQKATAKSRMVAQVTLDEGMTRVTGWVYIRNLDGIPFVMWSLQRGETSEYFPVSFRDKFGYDITQEVLDAGASLSYSMLELRPPANRYVDADFRSCNNCHYKMFDKEAHRENGERSTMSLRDEGVLRPMWKCRATGYFLDEGAVRDFNEMLLNGLDIASVEKGRSYARKPKQTHVFYNGKMLVLEDYKEDAMKALSCCCHTYAGYNKGEKSNTKDFVPSETVRRKSANSNLFIVSGNVVTARDLGIVISGQYLSVAGTEMKEKAWSGNVR